MFISWCLSCKTTIIRTYFWLFLFLPTSSLSCVQQHTEPPNILWVIFEDISPYQASREPGQIEDRLVSFIDFPKTFLSITGSEVPELIQGSIFLGEDVEKEPDGI